MNGAVRRYKIPCFLHTIIGQMHSSNHWSFTLFVFIHCLNCTERKSGWFILHCEDCGLKRFWQQYVAVDHIWDGRSPSNYYRNVSYIIWTGIYTFELECTRDMMLVLFLYFVRGFWGSCMLYAMYVSMSIHAFYRVWYSGSLFLVCTNYFPMQ